MDEEDRYFICNECGSEFREHTIYDNSCCPDCLSDNIELLCETNDEQEETNNE